MKIYTLISATTGLKTLQASMPSGNIFEDNEHYHGVMATTNFKGPIKSDLYLISNGNKLIENNPNNDEESFSLSNEEVSKNLASVNANRIRLLRRKKRMALRRQNHIRSRKRRQAIQLTDEEHAMIDEMINRRTMHWEKNFEGIDFLYGNLEDLTEQPEMLKTIMDLANSERLSSSLSKSKSPLLQALNPYGCWCNFDLIPGPYVGEPVNEFDAACKKLHEGYRCIGIDNGQQCADSAESYMLKPKYMRSNSKDQLIDSLYSYCDKMYPTDECGKNLCLVEAYFINQVFNLLQSGKRIDLKMSHKMGFDPNQQCELRAALQTPSNWDYEHSAGAGSDEYEYEYVYEDTQDSGSSSNEISSAGADVSKEEKFKSQLESLTQTVQKTQSSSPIDKNTEPGQTNSAGQIQSLTKGQAPPNTNKIVADQCCGRFPERAPYNPGSTGSKDCCDNGNDSSIFNAITHMCCPDGSVMRLGDC